MGELKIESPIQKKYDNSKKLIFELVRYYLDTINEHWLGSAGIYMYLPPLIDTNKDRIMSLDFKMWASSTMDCIKDVEEDVFAFYKSKYGEIQVNYSYPEVVSFVNDFLRKIKDHLQSATTLYLSSVEQILSDILGDKKVEKPQTLTNMATVQPQEEVITPVVAEPVVKVEKEITPEITTPITERVRPVLQEENPFDIDEYVTVVKNSCRKCLDLLEINYDNFNLTGFSLESSKGVYKFIYIAFDFIYNGDYQDIEIQIPYEYRCHLFFIKGVFYSTIMHLFDKDTDKW